MLRRLSAALSIERPSSPRVHPDEDAPPPPVHGGELAAAAGTAEADAAATGAEDLEASGSHEPTVTVVVQQGCADDAQASSDAGADEAATSAASSGDAGAAGDVAAERREQPPLLPRVRAPSLAVAAAAGAAAAAAAAGGLRGRSADGGGGTPIAAVKRRERPLRISFADLSGTPQAPPAAAGQQQDAKPPPLRAAMPPGQVTPRRSLTRNSLLAAIPYAPRVSRHDSEGTASDRKSSVFDLLDRKHSRPQARWRAGLNAFLQSGGCLLTSLVLTIMILYSDSLRQACTPASADPYFLAFTLLVLVAFSLEAAASVLANPRYARTFYFVVDLISSISILLDIPAITEPVISSANDGNGDVQQRTGLENAAQITAASTRAARLAQVTKWLRLWRILRLWAFYFKNRRFIIDRRTFFEAELEASGQSRVGEKLSELTIRKVVIMVLLVMFAMPAFDVSVGYYGGPPMLDSGGLDMLHAAYGAAGNSSGFQAALHAYLADTPYRLGRGHTGILTDLTVYNTSFLAVPGGVDGLRMSEVANFSAQTCPGGSAPCAVSFATYNLLWDSQIQGYLEIGRTTFIILILLAGAVWFIADTDRLVLRPLERMVALVKEVSENPLARVARLAPSGGRGPADKALETQVLESSIHKICSLLSVGFGEAGAEVIADNIRSGGDLNPMVPGRKVAAVFGFCDIRSFTDATEVLQEDVMEFVNSIAQIVHREVALHGGAANKNIGDAFLLVWKLPGSRREAGRSSLSRGSRSQGSGVSRMSRSSSTRMSMLLGGADREPERRGEAANVADQALASFIIVQAALKRSAKLTEFCNREDLTRRLPGFQVNMGFGLHVGWAIEGAIGSEHKIDASYLSPHVNMASRMEAATKQYGASILLSEDFVRMLSPGVRALVRQVDCVTVKGSTQPVGLFTYDVDPVAPQPPPPQKPLLRIASAASGASVGEAAAAAAATGDKAAASAAAAVQGSGVSSTSIGGTTRYETYSTRKFDDEFAEHPDIVLTRGADPEFLAAFAAGFEAYRSGDWPAARAALLQTLGMRRDRSGAPLEDGPSATLLRVMAGHNFVAPSSWAGYRELTEK